METNPKDHVATPAYLWRYIREQFGEVFDPCPLNRRPELDGLSIPWEPITYVNAPYSKQRDWTKKAYEEFQNGNTIVMLAKLSVLTLQYFRPLAAEAELRFINHRIKFPGFDYPAFFNSVLIVWQPGNPRRGRFSIINGRPGSAS